MSAASLPSRPVARPATPLAGRLLDLVLLALVGLGIGFRFAWVNWNHDTDLHPDEYGLTSTLTQLALPASLGDYFNTRLSPLSPYQKYDAAGNPAEGGPDNRMRWGQWPITLIRLTAELTDRTGYGPMRMLGRRLSALADSLSLAVIYLIGRRLYGHRTGLLAAALSALAVMQIQQSHFMTADNFAVLFAALAMYCAVRAAQVARHGGPGARAAGEWRWYVLFGVAFGMALASRINMAPLLGEVFVAAFIAYFAADKAAPPGPQEFESSPEAAPIVRPRLDVLDLVYFMLPRVALAVVFGLLTFRLTQPMSFRAATGDTSLFTFNPNPEWVESMKVAQAESSGAGGGPPGEQWTNRPALVFPFINMAVWGMGLPLGLMAWAGLLWTGWRSLRDEGEWQAHALPLTWAGGYFLFTGTRWVKSIRYFLPIYPFMALFAAWALVELWRKGQREIEQRRQRIAAETASPAAADSTGPATSFSPLAVISLALCAIVLLGTLAWAWGFTSIYRTDNTRVQASRWIYQNIPAPVNLLLEHDDGEPYVEPLPFPSDAQLNADTQQTIEFKPHVSGSLTGLTLGHARNTFGDNVPGVVRAVLSTDREGRDVLAEGFLNVLPLAADPRGEPAAGAFGPVLLEADATYFLRLTAPAGGPIVLAGASLANEAWDEGLPLRVDARDGFGGLYSGTTMEVRWVDDENKLQMFLERLQQVDYILVPSQRGMWSISRLPLSYPLTMEYYRALFGGRLGFELAAQFQSPIRLGPLQISDAAGAAAWGRWPALPPLRDYPFNFNPLAAEEAFTVYDHAPVWIFRKRADFDISQARAVLEAVDLSQVVVLGPVPATRAPGLLRLPPERLAEQRAGGTWSDIFDADGLLNRVQPLGAAVWWLLIVALGWLAFPFTYAALRGLPDRGLALSKTAALLCVAWVAWLLGSFRLLPFTRWTLILAVLVLAATSGLIYWRRRAEITAYLREHRGYILTVEGLALALFLFDLFIRWGNPDLWHPNYGGEKPMVFSYFNAVIKSTSFPPYNPWLAGYFLNYYYYGFVLVAVPVKLLGIVPNIAYNLILPTLFALTGVGAFCVAYNLVAHRVSNGGPAATPNLQSPISSNHSPPSAPHVLPSRPNPYLAGIAAMLLVVVLGNLGQWRTIVIGLQAASDRIDLEQSFAGYSPLTATLNGAWRVATGDAEMAVGLGSWYWDATRIISHINGEGGEITEFPFFTFLYADLHAHMIDLPFTLLALGWAASYLLGAGRPRAPGPPHWRSVLAASPVWILGGLALGVPRLANTWDFPTFLAIGVVAVVAGELLRPNAWNRDTLVGAGLRAVLVAGLAIALYRPFDQWFAPAYSDLTRWEGTQAPINAYLYIHGLFLFILTAFMARETRRWLAETPATVLQTARLWLPALLAAILLLLAAGAVLALVGIPAGAIAVPLMGWAGLLLLRPGEAMPVGKRAILFLCGTALAITLFVELYVLEQDRMNTVFKFYIQVWALFSVAGGAALAWVWAGLPDWKPGWRSAWVGGLSLLVFVSAIYTVTAAGAKITDRFPSLNAGSGCEPIPGMTLPYSGNRGLPPALQPRGLDGLAYMTWSAYCDHDRFLPLVYDYEAIRWMQDNVPGSPVIAEAQSFDLYRMSSRYTWNTGLPDVVGWDWHTRQHNAAIPTEFVTRRGNEVTEFYNTSAADAALAFLRQYDVRYVIVGPMERAYYSPEGLAKFDALAADGALSVVYQNPGVIIYEMPGPPN